MIPAMSSPQGGGPSASGLRVLTLNLLSPDHADWERRRAVLRDGLGALRPDVVAFQETVWGTDDDQVAGLAGDFDDPPDAASIRFWTGRQSLDRTSVCYQDAWEAVHPGGPGHTFSPRNFGVVADLRVPPRPPGSWD
jgi:hypothetical protein